MTVALIAAAAAALIAAAAVIWWAIGGLDQPRGARRMPRNLPHRPPPDAPPQPGPAHRITDAHTASLSATAVLRRLTADSEAAYERMRDAAARAEAEDQR